MEAVLVCLSTGYPDLCYESSVFRNVLPFSPFSQVSFVLIVVKILDYFCHIEDNSIYVRHGDVGKG